MKYQFLIIGITVLLSSKTYAICPTGQIHVQAHDRKSFYRSDGTFVKGTRVSQYCKTPTREDLFVSTRFKSSAPPQWPYKTEGFATWSDSEKIRVTDAFKEIPDVLLSNKISGIYRLKKSKDFPNPASSSHETIVIYDSAFDSSRNLARILSHEFAHQNYGELNLKDAQDYRRVMGWRLELAPTGKIYWVGRKNGYIEEDGKNSHEEDYANNIEHFLYDPAKLKQVTPEAYLWIKKHFGDELKIRKEGK